MPKQRIKLPLISGVNLHDDPRTLQDAQCRLSQNLAPIRPGILGSRPALRCVAQLSVDYLFGSNKTYESALALPFLNNGFIAYIRSTTTDAGNIAVINSLDGSTLNYDGLITGNTGLNAEHNPWMFVFDQTLYMLPGPNAIVVAGQSNASIVAISEDLSPTLASGTSSISGGTKIEFTKFAGTGTTNDAVKPRLGCAYRQRVVWANFGGIYNKYVIMSDDYDPLTVGSGILSSDGRAFSLPSAPGDEIVAMQEVMLTAVGSPAQSALLVLLRYSAYLITGELDQSTDDPADLLGDMVVNRISTDCGCISPWSVAKSPYGVLWCSADDVWLFDSGQIPRRVGTNIRPAIERASPGTWSRVRGIYHDDYYRLSLPGEGENPVSTKQGLADEWWLHLHDGAPQDANSAKWWGPQIFKAGQAYSTAAINMSPLWFRDNRPDRDASLIGVTYGFLSGAVGISLVELGARGIRDVVDPSADANAGYESGMEIEYKLVTKEYDAGEPVYQKLFRQLNTNLWVSNDANISLDVVMDGGYVSETIAKSLDVYGFITDTASQIGEVPMYRRPQTVAFYPTTRPLGATVQLEMYNELDNTLVIDSTNNVIIWSPNGGADVYSATVASGTYTTVSDLLTAITTALDASSLAYAGGFSANLNSGKVRFISAMPGTWVIYTVSTGMAIFDANGAPTGTVVTAAMVAKTLNLMTLLGFVSWAQTIHTSETATNGVYAVATHSVEIGGLDLQLTIIPRDPT